MTAAAVSLEPITIATMSAGSYITPDLTLCCLPAQAIVDYFLSHPPHPPLRAVTDVNPRLTPCGGLTNSMLAFLISTTSALSSLAVGSDMSESTAC